MGQRGSNLAIRRSQIIPCAIIRYTHYILLKLYVHGERGGLATQSLILTSFTLLSFPVFLHLFYLSLPPAWDHHPLADGFNDAIGIRFEAFGVCVYWLGVCVAYISKER